MEIVYQQNTFYITERHQCVTYNFGIRKSPVMVIYCYCMLIQWWGAGVVICLGRHADLYIYMMLSRTQ